MRFHIPINVPEDGGSQTIHIVDTESNCARTNKRKLREYFIAMGVHPTQVKSVMKKMGFWGDTLGAQEVDNG